MDFLHARMYILCTCLATSWRCNNLFWIVLDFSVTKRIVQFFFPGTFLLEEKKLTLTLTPTLRKIFPTLWKNFSGELEKFFLRVGVKVKVNYFLQVEKSQEKNLNNSLGNRKVQNNPEKFF